MRVCLAAVAVAVCTAIALGMILHGLGHATAALALVAGLGAGLLVRLSQRGAEKLTKPTAWDWLMFSVFAIVVLRAFLWLIFIEGDDLKVLSPNNPGDISLHLDMIRYLASGVPFWPESPILSGASLSYPLGVDLFNSLLTLCGCNVYSGLVWTGIGGAALTAIALWRWGGAFALAAFLFNGGLAGFAFFWGSPLCDYQGDLTWKNIFLSMFVTQRGLLYVLPAGLWLLSAWRDEFFRNGAPRMRWLQILIYSTLPLFNVHAFLFCSVVLLSMFVCCSPSRKSMLWLVGMAVVPATLCMLLVTAHFSMHSGIRWAPDWIFGNPLRVPRPMRFLGFPVASLIWNFGISLPLMAWLCIRVARSGDREARCFVWTGAVVFLVCSVISFAPWPWDNMKLMIWAWLLTVPYLWRNLLAHLPRLQSAIVVAFLFFSGALSLAAGLFLHHGRSIAKMSELTKVAKLIEDIPPDTRFACVPSYKNPLPLLGRPVACGHEGHLWSHGLDYDAKLKSLRRILFKQPGWKTDARTLGVDYLFIRDTDFQAGYTFWEPGLYNLKVMSNEQTVPASR